MTADLLACRWGLQADLRKERVASPAYGEDYCEILDGWTDPPTYFERMEMERHMSAMLGKRPK